MAIMEMERERRNPSAADIPHSARKIRGIDAESPKTKAVSFDEMRSCVGVQKGEKRRSARVWMAMIEEADGSLRFDFEVGGRDLPTFHRLLRRLPDAEKYRSDGYDVYGCLLPAERHERGKGSEVNRNEGLHTKLRNRLNRLGRSTSGYTKKLEMLAGSLAMVWLREGLI